MHACRGGGIGQFTTAEGGEFFLGYMAGGAGIWKRRFGEYILYETGRYIKFEQTNFDNSLTNPYVLQLIQPQAVDEEILDDSYMNEPSDSDIIIDEYLDSFEP